MGALTTLLLMLSCSRPGPEGLEDCQDGLDNDHDGLVDCEDGACAADARCFEQSCEDGRDEDNDGLTDCEDEECWGTEACAVMVVETLGGEASLSQSSVLAWAGTHWYSGTASGSPFGEQSCTWGWWSNNMRQRFRVPSLRGRTRFIASQTWSCDWTAQSFSWSWSYRRSVITDGCVGATVSSTGSDMGGTAAALQLSSGCRFANDHGPLIVSGQDIRPRYGSSFIRFEGGWPSRRDGQLISESSSEARWETLPNGASVVTGRHRSVEWGARVELGGPLAPGQPLVRPWSGPR